MTEQTYPNHPGQPDPYNAPPPPPAQPPAPTGTSGFAIASLIFGILGGVLFSVIFGIVALGKIKRTGQRGRGLAIAGLVLSGLWVLAIAGGATWAILSDDGKTSVTSIKQGDCLNELNESKSIENLPVVPCTSSHEGEVFSVFDLPAGDYPGDAEVDKQSEAKCNAAFKAYAPKADGDTLQLFYLRPLKENWSQSRSVTCVVTDTKGPRTGSVKN